jgi:hypothetical protein
VHAVPAASFTPKDEYLADLSKASAPSPAPTRASHAMVEAAKRGARGGENDQERAQRLRRRNERQSNMEDRSSRDARTRRELAAP